jgi:hypothetical protein
MKSIEIENIVDGTYPISVYISDIYKNNNVLIGTINSDPYPSIISFDTSIPEIFNNIEEILINLVDANQCERLKKLECDFDTMFQISII